MEVFEEFYAASESQGAKRKAKIDEYALMAENSNLFYYIEYHLTDGQLTEVQLFIEEIKEKEKQNGSISHMKYLEDEENWQDYDPSHLVEVANSSDETIWLSQLFEKCTRAIVGDYYIRFAIHQTTIFSHQKLMGHGQYSTPEIDYGTLAFNSKDRYHAENTNHDNSLICPKDGWILIDLNWNCEKPEPLEISGIEFVSRVAGDSETHPSLGEQTITDLEDAPDDWIGRHRYWISGKELLFTE